MVDITELRGVGDFTTLYRWNLIFASFPAVGVVGFPLTDDLNLRCESATLPNMTNEKIEINVRNHKIFQPGKGVYNGSIDLTFIETVDNIVHNFLKAWRELHHQTRTGVAVPKSDLEALIILQRLDNADSPIWQYTLHGCFLEAYDDGGTLGTDSDSLKPVLSVSYDFFDDSPL